MAGTRRVSPLQYSTSGMAYFEVLGHTPYRQWVNQEFVNLCIAYSIIVVVL